MLTNDQIEALAKKHICPQHDRLDAILANRVPYQQTEQFRRVKALISDVLSKLRAPVVDERAAFEAAYEDEFAFAPIWIGHLNGGKGAYASSEQRNAYRVWQRRAALASAPVADERAASNFELPEILAEDLDAGDVYLSKIPDPESLYESSGRAKIGYVMTVLRNAFARVALASAPVAGEVQPGYAIVPIEPTKEMLSAAFDLFELSVPEHKTGNDARRAIYMAMVNAAPQASDELPQRVMAQVLIKWLGDHPGHTPTEQELIDALKLKWD